MINATNSSPNLIYSVSQMSDAQKNDRAIEQKKQEEFSVKAENPAVESQNSLTHETFSSLLKAQEMMGTQQVEKVQVEEAESSSAVEEFREFMEMTPEERYIAQALAQKGYTQEEFDALPPEEQQKILEEIKEEYRQKLEEEAKSGEVGKPKD